MLGARRRMMRRTARRTARRVVRRSTAATAGAAAGQPAAPGGGEVLLAGEGNSPPVKLSAADAQKIQEHSGLPPEQLEDADLQSSMTELNIHSMPLTAEDQQALGIPVTAPSAAAHAAAAPAPAMPAPAAAPAGAQSVEAELSRYASMRDKGLISPEDYEAKKKQLLGL